MLQQILILLRGQPFHPFSIVTTSGDEYAVDHPENAAIVGGRVVVALPGQDAGVATLAGLHITAIKDLAKDATI
ncbi:MAG TPA: hypothetical protein VGH90_05100 [Chthoniobacteraceae bacterium]